MCAATPTTTPPTDLPLSSLCVACKSIFDGATPKNDNGEVDHHGLDALAARASRGCHLCLTVYMSIDPEAYKGFRRTRDGKLAETRGFACVIPIARDQARLKYRYEKTGGEEVEKGKGREGESPGVMASVSNGSKASLPLSVDSGEKDGEGLGGKPVVVELILMNPRCRCYCGEDEGGSC